MMKPARRPRRDQPAVPPVLPVVRMIVQDDGTMHVTVDGIPHLPPAFAPAWRRDAFPRIIDEITRQRTTGARIEVIEADGHTYTDLIPPTRTPPKPPPPTPPQREDAAREAPPTRPQLVQLTGSGFVPGEDVAVAIIVAHVAAAPDGTCQTQLDRSQLTSAPAGEAILFGRVSGTISLGAPA